MRLPFTAFLPKHLLQLYRKKYASSLCLSDLFQPQKLVLFGLVFFLLSVSAFGQDEDDKKKNRDFFELKAPEIKYSEPDMQEILFEDEVEGPESDFGGVEFIPEKEPSIVHEDTSSAEGELSIVEVSEQMKMDCVWVTIAEYYAIWDSRTVNPYKVDPTTYKDTLLFPLFDSTNGLSWHMPLSAGIVNSHFGNRHYRWHYGTDLDLTTGDPVYAAFDGIVRINQYDGGGYGNYVLLRHYNGLETLYGHLSKSQVKVGQLVKAGEIIGLGGSTGRSSGPHLHYEVRYEGNAIDPETVYDFANNSLRGDTFRLMPAHFDYVREARQVVYHKVRPGDTLSGISRKYRVSMTTICRLNRITTRSTLRVGQRLRIR